MAMEQRVRNHFLDSIQTKQDALEVMVPQIVRAAELACSTLLNNGEILGCGNAGCAADRSDEGRGGKGVEFRRVLFRSVKPAEPFPPASGDGAWRLNNASAITSSTASRPSRMRSR